MIETDVRILTTDEEIDAAIAAAADLPDEPAALSAEYIHSLDLVLIKIDDGSRLSIPREQLQGLENATPDQLANIQIFGGNDIAWPDLDVDHYLPYLLEGKYATEKWKQAHRPQRATAA